MVEATPSCCTTDGRPGGGGTDSQVGGAGRNPSPAATARCWRSALRPRACWRRAPGARVEAGVGALARRWPQCWQKANPDGVCLPHAGQMALPEAAAGAAPCAAPPLGSATGAGLGTSEVPHILQKFIPAGLAVPHELQTVPPAVAAGAGAAAGLGAAVGSNRCPQSWQNSEPSRFCFPQCEQRGIARLTSRV